MRTARREELKIMTSLENTAIDPVLPAPVPPRARLPLFKFLRTMPDNTIATFAQEAYERDIVERKLLGRRMFIINDPAAIKQVLLDNVANYEKTEITRRVLEPGLGKGLITLEGETWRRHRRTMAPAFDYRSIAAFTPIMTGAAEELLGSWNRLGAGAAIDAAEDMMEVTLKIISRTMFSSDSDDIMTVMSGAAGRYQAEIRPNILDLLGFPLWIAALGRKRAADLVFAEFDTVIDRLIETRARNPADGPKDLLARLIAARDEQTGGGMSAQEVRDHVITIFMAGHETTAMAMTWAWYLLSQHPAVEAKLHAELDSVLVGRTPSQEDLAALTYTRMVIEETMRIYPTVPALEREALADDTLVGRPIPKGSTVMIVPWVLHRHVKLWPNPGRFDPERFSAEQSAARPRFTYLPFGGGRRICIGAAFSLAEATILLATLAQRYRLQLVPGHPVEPQGLITLRPRHGMKMQLIPRS
ncbi:MAG: cytochrome P450 [Steroidobacteraceae bacterium]